MMETLKEVLSQSHSRKTKKELVDLISGIKEIVGDDYDKITGVQPSELSKLRNDELISIISIFDEKYDAKWEKGWTNASADVLKLVFRQMEQDANFTVANASDADFAAELGSIDFDKLIGGPLNACVTAQTNASLATVNFIKEVGFKEVNGEQELRMVDFSYEKEVPNPDFGKDSGDVPPGTNVDDATLKESVVLKVPFVSVLNLPSLRIENCTIDLNVKLNSVYTRDVSSEFGLDAEVSGGFGPVKFKVGASYKRSSSTGVKVEKEYTMGVKVVATNDEMPAGLEKVLGILSE